MEEKDGGGLNKKNMLSGRTGIKCGDFIKNKKVKLENMGLKIIDLIVNCG